MLGSLVGQELSDIAEHGLADFSEFEHFAIAQLDALIVHFERVDQDLEVLQDVRVGFDLLGRFVFRDQRARGGDIALVPVQRHVVDQPVILLIARR